MLKIKLRIQEAFSEDVGKGIARIDLATRKKIGVDVGDAILITGGKCIPVMAVVAEANPKDVGKEIIRMDKSLRRSIGMGINEVVIVSKLDKGILKCQDEKNKPCCTRCGQPLDYYEEDCELCLPCFDEGWNLSDNIEHFNPQEDGYILMEEDCLKKEDVKRFIRRLKENKEKAIAFNDEIDRYFPKGDKRRGEVLVILGILNSEIDKEIDKIAGDKLI